MGKLIMNKFKYILLVLVMFGITSAFAQEKYPIHVPKGETKSLKSDEFDLWVLNDNQFTRALSDSKELVLLREELKEFKNMVSVYETKEKAHASVVETLEKDRDFYKKNWEIAETDIKKIGSDYKKQKLYKNIAFGIIPVAFVLGVFIAK